MRAPRSQDELAADGGRRDEKAVAEQDGLDFGGLLRRLRNDARLTQEQLAAAARVSQRAVSDLERGINHTARKDTALLLAEALNLAEPMRPVFVAAARGDTPAAGVLVAIQRQSREASWGATGAVHGFPAALTSFIGRAEPLLEVGGLLSDHRLVTVTGPGGAGKTRLAVQAARQVADRFADGAWLVELAPVTDPAQVPVVVAATLGIREQPGLSTAQALARALARQQVLLLLDNCEHVIGAAAAVCAGLLAACDDVRVLATSREPLRVAGEARYRLASLDLPDLDDPAEAARAEAVVLFADRAQDADTHFTLDDQTAPAVARLVTRLDGMPLAIELAAAQVEALGLTGLLSRLDERLALLAGADRLAPSRQRSLAATVAWSYQLLDEAERRVFRAVSVFPAGFTLEGAEAVAGEAAGAAVLRLVDCSLLSPPRDGPDGRSRYLMLETLRAYGAGQLAETGEQDQAAAALARYALRVAGQAAAGLQTRTGEREAARWLDAEEATMLQALAWAMDHDPEVALGLTIALGWWWFLRGRLAGQRSLLAEVIGHAEVGSDRWCAVQFLSAWAAEFSADVAGAVEHFTVLRDAVAGGPPSPALADALAGRSYALRDLGQFSQADEDARRALAVAREVGHSFGEVVALLDLALDAAAVGDLSDAVRLARQAQQVPGDIPASITRTCSVWVTEVLIQANDFAAAERVCADGLAASRDAGDMVHLPTLLARMALLDLRAGRAEDAAASLREALQLASRTGMRFAVYLDCCGHLCAATGRQAEAVTMWAAYAALLPRDDWPADARLREAPLRAAQRVLGRSQTQAAEERGAAMGWVTAAEYALMLTGSGPQQPQAPGPALGKLSAQERELVTLVAQGASNAQIAVKLDIGVRTVGLQLDGIRDRTGCRRRADLTRLALAAGLV
jgi:predicted ATPase/DNA-binding CsgD family transcriptional regulator/transcriptional regulator with XRE-family HTH domain